MYRKLLPLLLALILAACQGGPLLRVGPTSTPFPDDFTGKAQVHGNLMTISCKGSGEPTIILERGSWEDRGWSLNDTSRFREITRTCFYVRLGKSTGVVFTAPRTVMDQVNDLHELLAQTGVPGPYILVGYHLAGYNLVLYTDQYPKDVAGIIWVGGWYPTMYDIHLEKLGPITAETSMDRKAAITEKLDYKAGKLYRWEDHPEYIDQPASEAQVLKVTSLKDVPLSIIQSEIFFNYSADPEVNRTSTEAVNQSQNDLCKLSSKCQTVVVPGIDFLSLPQNKAVDKAIQEMYDAVKKD